MPVPSGATTGNVVVTVGGVASNGVTFTVRADGDDHLAVADERRGGRDGDDHGHELRGDAGHEHGDVQRRDGDADVVVGDEHPVPRAERRDDGSCRRHGRRRREQRRDVHGRAPAPTGLPTMAVDRASLNFGAVNSGTSFTFQTPAQTVNITQTGTQNTVTWTAASDAPWLTVSPTSGSGPAALSIGVQHVSTLPPAGGASVTGAITVTYTGSETATSTVSARLNLPAASAPPTGLIDTPAAGATGLQGSIAVTGWAVDDVVVDRVELWRDLQPGETTPPFASTPSDPRNGKVFIGQRDVRGRCALRHRGAQSDDAAQLPWRLGLPAAHVGIVEPGQRHLHAARDRV